jgi:hypothetical protein
MTVWKSEMVDSALDLLVGAPAHFAFDVREEQWGALGRVEVARLSGIQMRDVDFLNERLKR